jgi:hypothetical protein
MEVSGQIHVPASLLTRKEPPVPIGSEVGGPQSRSGRGGEAIARLILFRISRFAHEPQSDVTTGWAHCVINSNRGTEAALQIYCK